MTISLELTNAEESVKTKESPYRSEQTIRSYCEALGGIYFGNWALFEILEAYDVARTPKGHLACQCRTSDGRTHFYSIPELRPSKRIAGPQGITQPKYTGEAK